MTTRRFFRVGQNRIYTYKYTVYLVISKPKIPYVNRIYIYIYMILANHMLLHSMASNRHWWNSSTAHTFLALQARRLVRSVKQQSAGSHPLPLCLLCRHDNTLLSWTSNSHWLFPRLHTPFLHCSHDDLCAVLSSRVLVLIRSHSICSADMATRCFFGQATAIDKIPRLQTPFLRCSDSGMYAVQVVGSFLCLGTHTLFALHVWQHIGGV